MITSRLVAVLLAVAVPLFARTDSPAPRNAAWVEDIDYLAARLQVMHPNLYAYTSREEFDGAVADLQSRVPRLTDNEIVMGIHEITALVRDAHTSVAPWKMGQCDLTDAWRAYPLTFYRFRDGMYVLAADERYRDLVGLRVVKFGDVEPDEALARTSRLVGGDNAVGRRVMGSVYLMIGDALDYCGIAPTKERLTLRLVGAAGREFERTLEAGDFGDALAHVHRMGKSVAGAVLMNDAAAAPLPLYLSHPGDAYWFEYLPEHEAMYVCLLDMEPKREEGFEDFFARMFRELDARSAKTLILDVRNNGGGDHHEMPLLKGVIARPHLDDRAHLFVITGRSVVSASQHFVTQFMTYTNATLVGEPTSSKPNFYGAQRFFQLPNSGLPVRTSVVFHQDATGWEMSGTTHPDYLVELDAADFAANRDPVLDLVLDFERYADLPARLETKLGEAYEAGGVGAMEDALEAFVRTPGADRIDEYAFFGDFIWWMFEHRKSVEDYGAFLELYTRRCPEASGAWYSLGMRRKNAGDLEGALGCLERALEAYPGNGAAKRERGMIRFEGEWAGR